MTTDTQRLKSLEGSGIKINYTNKVNQPCEIYGKLTFVSKERIIVIGSIEHIIKRDSIKSFEPIKYCKITKK